MRLALPAGVAEPGTHRVADHLPDDVLDLARSTAQACGWDDVGIDICRHDSRYYVLEANMKYGKEGFRRAGIDYIKLMENLIENEDI